MAFAVLRAIAVRLQRSGRLDGFDPNGLLDSDGEFRAPPLVERPPIASLRATR
jgi:hypothetical protein